MKRHQLRFTRNDAHAAQEAWGFNCGPGALCAILGRTPDEIRADLREFEDKRYTNPSLMCDILRGLPVSFRQVYRAECPHPDLQPYEWLPDYGLVRVQWSGPWTKPGVPMKARYRHSHWIAARQGEAGEACGGWMIYDVNTDDWMPFKQWSEQLVPWIIAECQPRADGQWWPTHSLEVIL